MHRRMSMIGYPTAAIAVVSLGLGLGLGLSQPDPGPHAHGGTRHAGHSRAIDTTAGGPASSALARCGHSCVSLYSRKLGPGLTMNAAIPENNGSGGKVGRKLSLQAGADKLADGDFAMSFTGQVSQFCGTDPHDFFAPESFVCQHDANFLAIEAEWTPYGNSTGLCVGVATANRSGQNVTLRPCGVNDHTLWIADAAHGTGGDCRGGGDFCPWMNASDNSFRAPQVLTMDGSTRSPADQLRLAPMNVLLDGKVIRAWNNQLFAFAPNKNS